MSVHRALAGFACVAAFPTALLAQQGSTFSTTSSVSSLSSIGGWPSRSYLGLSLGPSRQELSCLPGACEPRLSTHVYGGYMLSRHMGLELGYMDLGRVEAGAGLRVQALNLSLVGRAQLGESLGIYGRVGTNYGRTDTTALHAAPTESGFGLSYGAGLSWSFSPRGSATLGWDSQALQVPGMGRDTVRSTNLGLQWRY
jgi:OOP family OmpA-OmpF porin